MWHADDGDRHVGYVIMAEMLIVLGEIQQDKNSETATKGRHA